MNCLHESGDYIHGIWVCAHCFQSLAERPVIYGMAQSRLPASEARQQITWQAKIAEDECGTKFGKFVLWMVGHLRMRSLWTISKDAARRQCLDLLRDMGEPFGSRRAGWAKADAKELVREGILAYWDEAPSGGNT